MLDKTKVREIANEYSEEVRRVLSPDKVILFGSYVNGTPRADSDVDIAVLVSGISGEEWYNARIKLQDVCWGKIKFMDVEPHLLDETQDPSGFVEHVIKTGEVIYQCDYSLG